MSKVAQLIPTMVYRWESEDTRVELIDYGDHWEVVVFRYEDGESIEASRVVRNERHGARFLYAETLVKALGYRGVR